MIAAWIYLGLCLGLGLFQIALILGAPWGHLTQGGRRPGALPPAARALAALSAAIIVFMALAILSAAGGWPGWPRWTGWLAVGITGLSALANGAAPSRPERRLWGPVALILLACALWVMIL